MNAIRVVLSALLLLVATPAWAQLTAIYSDDNAGTQIKIEVSPSGDIRVSGDGAEGGMMVLGGEVFLLNEGPNGPEVMRASDFATATAEQFARLPQPDDSLTMPAMTFEKRGEVEINGRRGTAYYLIIPGLDSSGPSLVISSDPALAPLGIAMSRQFEAAMGVLPVTANELYPFKAMLAILKTGAPLAYAGQSLVSVDDAPIPAERFVLPAQPLTLEQVRTRVSQNFAPFTDAPAADAKPAP